MMLCRLSPIWFDMKFLENVIGVRKSLEYFVIEVKLSKYVGSFVDMVKWRAFFTIFMGQGQQKQRVLRTFNTIDSSRAAYRSKNLQIVMKILLKKIFNFFYRKKFSISGLWASFKGRTAARRLQNPFLFNIQSSTKKSKRKTFSHHPKNPISSVQKMSMWLASEYSDNNLIHCLLYPFPSICLLLECDNN